MERDSGAALVIAALFLLSAIPAAIVSAQGQAECFWVYTPLPFLFLLMISGTYMLVEPWIRRLRGRPARQESNT